MALTAPPAIPTVNAGTLGLTPAILILHLSGGKGRFQDLPRRKIQESPPDEAFPVLGQCWDDGRVAHFAKYRRASTGSDHRRNAKPPHPMGFTHRTGGLAFNRVCTSSFTTARAKDFYCAVVSPRLVHGIMISPAGASMQGKPRKYKLALRGPERPPRTGDRNGALVVRLLTSSTSSESPERARPNRRRESAPSPQTSPRASSSWLFPDPYRQDPRRP